ncbi:MAG TPA: TIGR03435 family protein [Terriglobales bacterium]|nr:TIGR03435 family protein [Terriglobales bacterium]
MRMRWLLFFMTALVAAGQSAPASAPKRLQFDVASVKPSDPKGGRPHASMPLTAGERSAPNDGLFTATQEPLIRYIAFAFDFDANPDPQLKVLPDWVNSERYDIEARASGPATKVQMRAMVLSLLEDRFQLTFHYETRHLPVYELVLAKPGKLGPQMRPHVDEGMPCDATAPAPPPAAGGRAGQRATPDGYPVGCGELMSLTPVLPGRWRLGGRNITMDFFVATLRGGMERPVVDRTGLKGRYDWVMEYVPDGSTDGQFGANFHGDPDGPKMWTAIKEQLGLVLKPAKDDIRWLAFDHIARPTAN